MPNIINKRGQRKLNVNLRSSYGLLGVNEELSLLKIFMKSILSSKISLYLKVNSLKLLHVSSCLPSLEALPFRLILWWLPPPPLFSLLGSKESHMLPCKTEWLSHFIFNAPLDSCFRFYMLVQEHSNRLWQSVDEMKKMALETESFMFWLKNAENLNLFNAIICQYVSNGLLVAALSLIK